MMALLPEYTPTYIKQTINAATKQVITAERWNELFNLLITQGDNTTADVVALLTALAATTAAANIGADVTSVVGKTVQEVLTAFETRLSERYTKTESNALVATNTNDLVKSITFNDQDGKFTITKKDGAVVVIDTVLEKVPVSMVFETVGSVTRIRLTNQDGTTSTADVSALVDNYTFSNTDTIALTATGVGNQKSISATLRDNSVTLPKLSLTAVTQLESYRDAAANSAVAAAASATTASGHKDTAAASATSAANSATAASNSAATATADANQANASATSASLSAQTAGAHRVATETAETNAETAAATSQSWAVGGTGTRVGEDTNNAKYYAESAAAVVGQKVATFNGRDGVVVPQAGDYTAAMVGATPAAHATDATKHVGTDTKTAPVDADGVALVDSADANKVKKLTWANLKTALTSVFAIKSHASSATTYGQATGTNFGHAKLSDATNSTSGVASGIAATPAAVKAAYDIAAAAVPTTRTVNGKALSSDVTLAASDVGATTVADLQAASSDSLIRDLNIMLNQSLGTSNIDAWADLLSDAGRINTGISSGYVLGSGAITATTSTAYNSGSSGINGAILRTNNSLAKRAIFFTLTEAVAITKVTIRLSKNTTPAGNVTVEIYKAVSGFPTEYVASTTTTLAANSLTTGLTDYGFDFSSVLLAQGDYAVVVSTTGSIDPANTINLGYTVGTSNSAAYSASTQMWSATTEWFKLVIEHKTATVIWKAVTATETFSKMAVAAEMTLGTGTITFYVSHNGTTWTQITALNAAQAVSFTGTSVYLKAVITGNASLSSVAWGGY